MEAEEDMKVEEYMEDEEDDRFYAIIVINLDILLGIFQNPCTTCRCCHATDHVIEDCLQLMANM